MEENVALDSSKQKQFVKSIKGIKKILKKKDKTKLKKGKTSNVEIGKVKKPSRKKRGLVYLSHIPHGFYEHQMTEYFKQFGVVTNARVIRSKRTGMSKGHAFVEFKNPHVAQIVAETMNNYLMGKRLIKASIIPPEKQRKFAQRKHWNQQNNPGNDFRQKIKKAHNSLKDEKEELKIARKLLSNLNKTKKRLSEIDINYDFFTPVDIPEPLLNLVQVKTEVEDNSTDVIKIEDKIKVKQEEDSHKHKKNKGNKNTNTENMPQNPITPNQADSSSHNKSKKSKEPKSEGKASVYKASATNNVVSKVLTADNKAKKQSKDKGDNKKDKNNSKVSKKQEQKEEKLKVVGITPMENFIQISNKTDDASDSSVDFDSDEFDKVMAQDDSDVESYDANHEDSTSGDDDSVENDSPKKGAISGKGKVKATQNKQVKKLIANKPPLQLMKRKAQRNAKPSKKPKFEKAGNMKTLNKVFKKTK